MLQNLLSFEKPLGPILTQLLYYFGLIGILIEFVRRMWVWATYLDDNWDAALWGLLKTPVLAVIAVLVLRVIAEFVLAQFRTATLLHDQVTGRVTPPGD